MESLKTGLNSGSQSGVNQANLCEPTRTATTPKSQCCEKKKMGEMF